MVNGIRNKVKGLITRRRITTETTEESIIDFLIISSELELSLDSLLIDEEKLYAPTNFRKNKNKTTVVTSDHHSLISKFNFKWSSKIKNSRREMYNLKNPENIKKFKLNTTKDNSLSNCLEENDLNIATNAFINKLNEKISQSFQKIRIKERKDTDIDKLFNVRNILRRNTDSESKVKLEKVETELSEKCGENNAKKIMGEIGELQAEDGSIHMLNMWKLKQKISPRELNMNGLTLYCLILI